MPQGLTRIGLVLGAALLSGIVAAGPALAGPAPAADEPGVSVADDDTKVPAPTRVAKTPDQPKLENTDVAGPGVLLPAHLDGTCNSYASGTGDLCLWYFSSYSGSHVDFYGGDNNLFDNVFLTAGSGKGAVVANNSESAYNYDSIWTAWVCTGSNQTGSCGYIRPRTGGNFLPTWFNNVESLHWTK